MTNNLFDHSNRHLKAPFDEYKTRSKCHPKPTSFASITPYHKVPHVREIPPSISKSTKILKLFKRVFKTWPYRLTSAIVCLFFRNCHSRPQQEMEKTSHRAITSSQQSYEWVWLSISLMKTGNWIAVSSKEWGKIMKKDADRQVALMRHL